MYNCATTKAVDQHKTRRLVSTSQKCYIAGESSTDIQPIANLLCQSPITFKTPPNGNGIKLGVSATKPFIQALADTLETDLSPLRYGWQMINNKSGMQSVTTWLIQAWIVTVWSSQCVDDWNLQWRSNLQENNPQNSYEFDYTNPLIANFQEANMGRGSETCMPNDRWIDINATNTSQVFSYNNNTGISCSGYLFAHLWEANKATSQPKSPISTTPSRVHNRRWYLQS